MFGLQIPPPTPPPTCSSRTERGVGGGRTVPRVSQGRGSLGEHGYVRLRVRPLSTLSPGQVTLEATVRYTQLQTLFVVALVVLCLWLVDMKVVLWLVAVDVFSCCGHLSQGGTVFGPSLKLVMRGHSAQWLGGPPL